MFCRNCGTNCADTATFCPNCGTPMSTPASAPQPQPTPTYTQPYSAPTAPAGGFADSFRQVTGNPMFMVATIIACVYFLFSIISSIIAIVDVGEIQDKVAMARAMGADPTVPGNYGVSVVTLLVTFANTALIAGSMWMLFLNSKKHPMAYNVSLPMQLVKIGVFVSAGFTALTGLMALIAGCGASEDSSFFCHIFYYFGSVFGAMEFDYEDTQVMLTLGSVVGIALYAVKYVALINIIGGISTAFKTGTFSARKWVSLFMIFAIITSGFGLLGNLIKLTAMDELESIFSNANLVFNMLTSLIELGFVVVLSLCLLNLKKKTAPMYMPYGR